MEKSKIKSIVVVRTYNNKANETIYVSDAVMENGQYGELHTKTSDRYKVGQEIEYTLESKVFNGNTSWSIKPQLLSSKPGFNGGGSGGSSKINPERELSIVRQSSLNRAVELCVSGKISFDDIIRYSDRFVKYVTDGK